MFRSFGLALLAALSFVSATANPADPAKELTRRPLPPVAVVRTLRLAGWPDDLLADAASVAYCESRFDPATVGDGGLAIGLFQIHSYLWAEWAVAEFGEKLDATDPVDNARLALLIVTEYRGSPNWDQWTCKPGWITPPGIDAAREILARIDEVSSRLYTRDRTRGRRTGKTVENVGLESGPGIESIPDRFR